MRHVIPWLSSPFVQNAASVATAVGTLAIAALAIWGDSIKDWFIGPKLDVSLVVPLRSVTGISKRGPDASFVQLPLVYPLQLSWSPSQTNEPFRTVVEKEIADFGFLDENSTHFNLAALFTATNVDTSVKGGEALRYEIVATAYNAHSSKPLFVQVAWNGRWSADKTELSREHLRIDIVDRLRD